MFTNMFTFFSQSVCNLGVWCLSIQQFPSLYLAENFHSLLRAIVHALDNPIGSLSITFEATQVIFMFAVVTFVLII